MDTKQPQRMLAQMAQFSGGRMHFAWHGCHNGDLDAAAELVRELSARRPAWFEEAVVGRLEPGSSE